MLRALHALVLEAVRFGWTMLVVQAVKAQLKIVRTMGGAYKLAITVKMPRWFVQVSYVDQDYSRVILSIANVLLFKKTLSGEKKKGFKPRMQDNMGFQVYLQVILTSCLLYSSVPSGWSSAATTICFLFTNCDWSAISSLRRFTVKPGQALTLSVG